MATPLASASRGEVKATGSPNRRISPAVGVSPAATVSGGHAARHSPVQLLTPGSSTVKM